jgi:hypothetical protein
VVVKEPHLLRVAAPPAAFAPLAAALAAEGMCLGWLELGAAPPEPLSIELEAALELGVLRAVAVGPGRSLAAKPLRGEPVLRDLLREHFRGCRLVLVAGRGAPQELPELAAAAGDGYRVAPSGEAASTFAPATLAARLRRPRPWAAE